MTKRSGKFPGLTRRGMVSGFRCIPAVSRPGMNLPDNADAEALHVVGLIHRPTAAEKSHTKIPAAAASPKA